jgi:hypothetical protein
VLLAAAAKLLVWLQSPQANQRHEPTELVGVMFWENPVDDAAVPEKTFPAGTGVVWSAPVWTRLASIFAVLGPPPAVTVTVKLVVLVALAHHAPCAQKLPVLMAAMEFHVRAVPEFAMVKASWFSETTITVMMSFAVTDRLPLVIVFWPRAANTLFDV